MPHLTWKWAELVLGRKVETGDFGSGPDLRRWSLGWVTNERPEAFRQPLALRNGYEMGNRNSPHTFCEKNHWDSPA